MVVVGWDHVTYKREIRGKQLVNNIYVYLKEIFG